jgi:hypothetical protein
MEKIGVVFEIMVNEKEYTMDTFQFDFDRMHKTIEASKGYNDKKDERKEFLLQQLHGRINEMKTEDYRSIIINYLAMIDKVKQTLNDKPNKSIGIYLHRKLDKSEINVLEWTDFEKMLKELPDVYFD